LASSLSNAPIAKGFFHNVAIAFTLDWPNPPAANFYQEQFSLRDGSWQMGVGEKGRNCRPIVVASSLPLEPLGAQRRRYICRPASCKSCFPAKKNNSRNFPRYCALSFGKYGP
jgi:hypothetical protein